jgi:hypothetical protein
MSIIDSFIQKIKPKSNYLIIHRKEIFKIIGFVGLCFLITILTIISVAQYYDYKIDFIGINPSEPMRYQTVTLLYPETAPDIPINDNRGNPVNLPLFSINIGLQYNGTLSEGSTVYVSSVGCIYPEGRKDIIQATLFDQYNKMTVQNYSVVFGFEGASLRRLPETIFDTPHGEFPIDFINADRLQIYPESSLSTWPMRQAIVWNNQGDYHPYTIISFKNGTTVYVPYQRAVIHVDGLDVIRQERYSRINTWLAIVIFFFTVVTSFTLLYQLRPKTISKILGVNEEIQNPNSNSSTDKQQSPSIEKQPPEKSHDFGAKHKKRN